VSHLQARTHHSGTGLFDLDVRKSRAGLRDVSVLPMGPCGKQPHRDAVAGEAPPRPYDTGERETRSLAGILGQVRLDGEHNYLQTKRLGARDGPLGKGWCSEPARSRRGVQALVPQTMQDGGEGPKGSLGLVNGPRR